MDPIVPTLITPQQAADALGITITELARNMQQATEDRLGKLAAEIRSFECGSLEDFDEHVGGARRMFESLLACWAVIDSPGEDSDE